MNRAAAFVVLATLLNAFPARAQLAVTGTVRDAATGAPLDAAIIRERGTSRGTITNRAGSYLLILEPGAHVLIASMLGYRPDTARVDLPATPQHDFLLTPAEILLPEVVVVSEDPAIGIIRRAIEAKHRWAERLTSYEMHAFTRQVLHRDTAIASITESFTTGYWQRGDTLREVMRQKRQTANIPAAQNFASVGRILNFNENEIRFAGYTFVGPTADDALDYYRYRLLRTLVVGQQDVFEIQITPARRTAPLFRGTIMIADSSYALVGVNVEPNEAFQIPFVSDRQLRYRQQFALYEGIFWMPVDIQISARFGIGLLGLRLPPIAFDQTSVVSRYAINIPLPDSLFHRPRLVVDSSATRIDSSYWAGQEVLPLGPEEQRAYRSLDSSQTLEVQFRPGGATATLAGASGTAGTLLSLADVRFNRVEGLHLGAHGEPDLAGSHLTATLGAAYGFSSRLATYRAGLTFFPSVSRTVGVGGEVYRDVAHRTEYGFYNSLSNSLAALLGKADYFDYYRAEGWRAFLQVQPWQLVHVDLSYRQERHASLARQTNFSLLYPSRTYRMNLPVQEGRFQTLQLGARLGREPVPFDLAARDVLEFSIEHASPSLTGGDFDFSRAEAVASVSVTTFAQSMLFPSSLRVRAAAGTSRGQLPLQRAFALESSLSGIGPFGVMRGLHIDEYGGTSYLALNVEHNFRNTAFLALGIPFLYEIDLLLRAGAAKSWNGGTTPFAATPGWYSEAGIGLGRLMELFRADLTWRLTPPRTLVFTLGVTTLL